MTFTWRQPLPWLLILSIGILPFMSFTCGTTEELTDTGLKAGIEAPEIACTGLVGNCEPLSALKGKLVLVQFWASTCDMCRRDHFEMQRLYQKYGQSSFGDADGFAIYSIAIEEDTAAWRNAVAKDRITWPNQMCDTRKWSAPSVISYEINSLPKYFLLDEDGEILSRHVKVADLEVLLKDKQTR